MAKFGFPVPIVPGKEDLAGRIYDEMRGKDGRVRGVAPECGAHVGANLRPEEP